MPVHGEVGAGHDRVGLIVGLAVLASGCFFNVTSYTDTDGSTVYVGEVRNDGPPLSGPYVTGTFYDANGNVITTQDGDVCRVMPTSSIAAFKVRLPAGTPKPARVEWKLNGTEVENPYLAEGLTAWISATAPASPGTDLGLVYGEMRNDSASTYIRGYVCIAWVNAKGEVLRVGTGSAAGLRLAPGQTLPFAVRENPPAEATDALFFLDAGVTPPGQPQTTIVDLPDSAFRNASERSGPNLGGNGTLYLGLGEIHNGGSSTLSASLSAVARGSDGKPVAVGGGDYCDVPAFPDSFTYGVYLMTTNASPPPPPDLKLEGAVLVGDAAPGELTPTNVTKSGSGIVKVSGKIKNTLSEPITMILLCAGSYDASGAVIGVNATRIFIDAGLAPGATRSFTIDVPSFGDVSTVKAIAAGVP